jgi:hypothetical protein
MNGLQSLKQWTRFFGYPSTSMIGTINAVYPAGKIVGLTSSAFTGDRYGRRVPFVLGLVLMLLGAGLQGGSQNLAMFIVARLILGCGTGFIAQTSPILLSELSYPTQRGQIASLYFSSYVSRKSNCPNGAHHILTNALRICSISDLSSRPGRRMELSGCKTNIPGAFHLSCKHLYLAFSLPLSGPCLNPLGESNSSVPCPFTSVK